MPNIQYRTTGQKDVDGHDVEYGTWPGVSKRKNGKVVKEGRFYLGRVVDKAALIFYNKTVGFFRFDPSDQSIHALETSAPISDDSAGEQEEAISSFRFGGSYFLGRLISGIEYDAVLNSIVTKSPDDLRALLHYDLLSPEAGMIAEIWLDKNYAKYLYPRADLCSQRISELYETTGKDDAQRMAFLRKHIEYVLKAADNDCCILIVAPEYQETSPVPVTETTCSANEDNPAFRVILAVQRSTGFPLYYETIRGKTVDSAALDRVRETLKESGLKVSDILDSAEYSYLSGQERLILAGSEVMRLNPASGLCEEVMKNASLLDTPDGERVKRVVYRNHHVNVMKIRCVIGTDKESNAPVEGVIYLCLDEEACQARSAQVRGENHTQPQMGNHRDEEQAEPRVFAILHTRDLDERDALTEYYLRQEVDQSFHHAKDCPKGMPVTDSGHVLIAFIAMFLRVLIRNRLNMMYAPYCAVPEDFHDGLVGEENTISIQAEQGTQKPVWVQEPLKELCEVSPDVLLNELELICGMYRPKGKGTQWKKSICIDSPHERAGQFLKAFGLDFPLNIVIPENGSPLLQMKAKETCSGALVFTSPLSEEKLLRAEEAKRRNQPKQQVEATAGSGPSKLNVANTDAEETQDTGTEIEEKPQPKKRGRPAGSLNRKTLERLAEQEKLMEQGLLKPAEKRGRGRPKGSKNKEKIGPEEPSGM